MLHKTLNIKGTLTSLETPLVMGILNITPDSFYADSRKQTEAAIEERIQAILSEGGQTIDLGGYSSRPDASEVSPEEEMKTSGFCLEDTEYALSGCDPLCRYFPGGCGASLCRRIWGGDNQ